MNQESLLIVFVALTGVAVLLQAVVLLALFVSLRKGLKSTQEQVESILPAVRESREFINRIGPKIETVATDLAEISQGLRAQGKELEVVTMEVLERVRRQSGRIDKMFTNMMDTAERASNIVGDVVTAPLRQLAAVAAGVKAAAGVLISRNVPGERDPRETHAAADKEMFV